MKTRVGKSGFSLLEVLVAFGVLAVALLALLGVLPQVIRQGGASTMQIQAVYRAEIEMEELLENPSFDRDQTIRPAFASMPDSYVWIRTCQPADLGLQGLSPRTQVARVVVGWTERSTFRTVELTSLIYH
ncbi:MAG: prepilin-type N-terminal cleavage/methylation domain-containing protein [Candidatus Eremiobacterota bacterium]